MTFDFSRLQEAHSIVVFAFIALMTLAGAAYQARRRLTKADDLQRLLVEKGYRRSGNDITGELGGYSFVVRFLEKRVRDKTVRTTRVIFPSPTKGLILHSSSFTAGAARQYIGDEAFDKRWVIDGNPASTAWLSHALRTRLMGQYKAVLEGSSIGVEFTGHLPASRLQKAIEDALGLRQAVPHAETPEEALLLHFDSEPIDEVRAYWLSVLTPGTELAVRLATPQLTSPHAGLRGRAMELADDFDGLRNLATTLESGPQAIIRAIRVLLREDQPVDLTGPLQWAVRWRKSEASQLVRVISQAKKRVPRETFGALVDLAYARQPPGIFTHAVQLLSVQSAEVESDAVRLLACGEHKALSEVLVWLSKHGTLASVPALRTFQEAQGFMSSLTEPAEATIRHIQGELASTVGGVSFAENTGGEVSVASDHGGLSEVPRPAKEPVASSE